MKDGLHYRVYSYMVTLCLNLKEEEENKVSWKIHSPLFGTLSGIKWLQSPPDHSCGGSNRGPSYQVKRQSPLNQLTIGVVISFCSDNFWCVAGKGDGYTATSSIHVEVATVAV
jgi:hypothetical protein